MVILFAFMHVPSLLLFFHAWRKADTYMYVRRQASFFSRFVQHAINQTDNRYDNVRYDNLLLGQYWYADGRLLVSSVEAIKAQFTHLRIFWRVFLAGIFFCAALTTSKHFVKHTQ